MIFDKGDSTTFTMRFTLWADALRTPLTAERIRNRYGCSRATAYRYRAAYYDAKGICPPESL